MSKKQKMPYINKDFSIWDLVKFKVEGNKLRINDDYHIKMIIYNKNKLSDPKIRLLLMKNNENIVFSLEYVRDHEKEFYGNVDIFTLAFVSNINNSYLLKKSFESFTITWPI